MMKLVRVILMKKHIKIFYAISNAFSEMIEMHVLIYHLSTVGRDEKYGYELITVLCICL